MCDQCWHLAGGTAAVRARITHRDERGEQVEPLLVFDPATDALFAGVGEYDALHPSDRLLVESGVRWAVLRHIAVPARIGLARQVLDRTPPRHTRTAHSPRQWIEAVETRIREQAGTEFKYNAKRRRWWQISSVFRHCADRDRRPLTWVTQDEIAAAVGCSTRTVRRCVAWLQSEGLLFEVVPGCQLPQQATPDGEIAAEREERHRKEAEAALAEEAAIARARAELDAARSSQVGAHDVMTAPWALLADPSTEVGETHADRPLVRLAPVYELRLPTGSFERGPRTSEELLTSGNDDPLQCVNQNGHPPLVTYSGTTKSTYVHPVENRRAPRDSNRHRHPKINSGDRAASTVAGADKPRSRQSEAVRAAHWLLRSRLDPRVCDEVSVRWLAAQIRGSHLLDRHDWTWDDLADQLHGYPEYPHLPRYIRDCRAWIRARFTRAIPTLSPTKLRIIQHIEHRSPALRRQRQAEIEERRTAEIAKRRGAIDACELCDEQGWLHVPADTPTVRCNHDLTSGGW